MRVQVMRAQRSREGPARIHAAQRQCGQHQDAAYNIQVPAQQVDLRKRQVLRAHHDRNQKVPDRRRHRRHQEQEDHDDAVHGEHLVIGVRRHQVARRSQQLQPDHPRKEAADKEEDRDRDQVQDRDPLVISGQQPALQAVFLVQIGPLRQGCRRLVGQTDNCAHGFTIPGAVAAVCCAGPDVEVWHLALHLARVQRLLNPIVGVELFDVFHQVN